MFNFKLCETMGGNGTGSNGLLETEESRHYKGVLQIGNNIVVLEPKDSKLNIKLPEESHTPNRIYVAINKPPKGDKGLKDPYAGKLKSIGIYGSDCKKLYEIHVDHSHNGMKTHYHTWENGHPIKAGNGKHAHNVAHSLTPQMISLLNLIKQYVPYYE